MEKEFWMQNLKEKAEKLQIKLSIEQIEKYYQYMNLLIEWNQKMNLTAIVEPNEIIVKHFIDSLTIYSYTQNRKSVLDIGTGAGFPGIPLKILQKETSFTLLDSLNKRITFLQEVICNLNLQNVQAVHGRAEEFVKQINKRENYEIVTSRAVARLNTLLEYMLPFVKIGGLCICMKSAEIEEELQEAKKAIEILGGEIQNIDTIILPNSEIQRKIVVIKKVRSTPKKYPRKAGTPTKEPLQ